MFINLYIETFLINIYKSIEWNFPLKVSHEINLENETFLINIYKSTEECFIHISFLYEIVSHPFWPRSAGLISRLKNTVSWFVVREKILFRLKKQAKKDGL
jgi:hypothetical protein